jgi:hypothetical protein
LNKKIKECISNVSDAQVMIATSYSVGEQIGIITEASRVYFNGQAEEGSCSI